MDARFEDTYAEVEERHPWFVARRELFTSFVRGREEDAMLDVGCGTGMFLSHLHARGFRRLTGVETSAALRERFREPTLSLFDSIPDGPFQVVFMLDVLEHIEDDCGTLQRIAAILEPGGTYHISVPAHPFLWSRHDEQNHHVRRYTKKELMRKLEGAGFRIDSLSYWNCFSFLPLLIARSLRLGGGSSELERGNAVVHWFLGRILAVENWLVRRIGLPFGVSLVVTATKPRSPASA